MIPKGCSVMGALSEAIDICEAKFKEAMFETRNGADYRFWYDRYTRLSQHFIRRFERQSRQQEQIVKTLRRAMETEIPVLGAERLS